MRGHYTSTRLAKIKRLTIPSTNKDFEQPELSFMDGKKLKWYCQFGKLIGSFIKYWVYTCHITQPFYLEAFIHEKGKHVHKKIWQLFFFFLVTDFSWKKTKFLTNEWISKLQYIHPYNGILLSKRKKKKLLLYTQFLYKILEDAN